MIHLASTSLILGAAFLPATGQLPQVRIKDITSLQGDRENHLTGWGLVTGLNGTGGTSPQTRQALLNFTDRSGLRNFPELRSLRGSALLATKNVAVVMVSADLPVNAPKDSKITATVAVLDDATSLAGGQLMPTPLFGYDEAVYATAAGPVVVGGFAASGAAASVSKNHPLVGKVDNVRVEVATPFDLTKHGEFTLVLLHPDFHTVDRIATAINQAFPGSATPESKHQVIVTIPRKFRLHRESFVAAVQRLQVEPDAVAKVVINERTGTVVFGEHVKISRAFVNHANLTVSTSESPIVSQPAPFSQGETTVLPRTDVEVVEQSRPIKEVGAEPTVGDLVATLNAMGATPQDLVQIFIQLDRAHALQAELSFE